LDAATLKTKGFTDLGMPRNSTILYAHSKIDGKSGDWIFFGLEFGLRVLLHITIFGKDGRLKGHREIKLPRPAYMHDFFATGRYLVFNLPAMSIDFFEYLMGQKSFLGSMRWTPEIGNIILVIDRQGDNPPFQLSAEPCWMWHVINAYERGNEIIADFIGYQNPDHIIGDDPALCAVMEGRKGQYNFPGEIRRYIIHTTRQTVYSEILDKGDYEFPFVNPQHVCHRHRFGYFANKLKGEIFFTGIARVDMETLDSDSYRFGKDVFCSEPVFIPKPQYLYSSAKNAEPGWLLTEVLDAGNLKTSLALFESDCLSVGPVAWVHLYHFMPLGLHGFWHPYP
jgi:all-trans-8'-apo-beta-carotenal 15,15'-oxygenase